MNLKRAFAFTVFFLFLLHGVKAQFYNGYQMTFGKNRVQYDQRFWNFYKWQNFDTYFYLGGQELAIFTGRTAQTDLDEIEKLLDYKLDGRIQFIVYNKLSDAKQSNIGLETDDNSNNIGGVTRIVGNKVFLYFTGDHEALHKQMRAGIAKILIDQMMYGGDVKERIQNSALLTLPDWYLSGLISYIADHWNTNIDNRVRDGIVTKRYYKFNHLTGDDALYAGHSIWKYIIDTYGESSVSNLLYMTRINRNVESGFLYVLGLSVKALADNWKESMTKIYANSDGGRLHPDSQTVVLAKPKAKLLYSQLKASPDGRYAVYATNDIGKYKVYLYDLVRHKKKKILRSGYRSYTQETDVSFPLMAWHPTGELVALIREWHGATWLDFYTVRDKKWQRSKLFNFEKVLDFSYSPDGQSLLFSAVQKGQSDIFIYNLRTRTFEQLTKDFYDDIQPRFISNGKAIVFSSNRPNDTLDVDKRGLLPANNNFDIFYYDYEGRSKLLKRITNTAKFNEYQPMPYDSSNFAYLSDENGIVNRYAAHLDSTLSAVDTIEHYSMIVTTYPQTNYSRNIISHDINPGLNRISEIFYQNGRMRMYVEPLQPVSTEQSMLPNTLYRNEANKTRVEAPPKPEAVKITLQESKPTMVDSNAVDIDNYVFQSEFPKSKNKKEEKKKEEVEELKKDTSTASAVVKADSLGYTIPKERIYETAFSSNYFVAQLDNSLLNNTYQLFSGGGGVFFNPSLNGFFKIGISDLLDDYKIVGGFKLAGDLNSNEYFLSYENLKHRIDHQVTFYRQSRFATDGYSLDKIHTHEVRYFAKYPFSDVTSLRGSVAYRNDRLVYLSTDINNLQFPNLYLHWGSARLEFVFDNTLNTGLNLYNGTRTKLFAEYYRQIDQKKTNMYIFGVDYRYYLKIHREIIWANRFAASTSIGDRKLIYYLGGTDSWIGPRFNTETPIDYSQNYVYQTVATNLRGFDQNIRNGNSFALVNSELRVPVFRYLFNRPIKSDFLRNFQVVGFGDVGTAWNGASPYDSANALNNHVITAGNYLTITVITQHDPIVGGFGFGLRSRVLGYFVRGDWAWGMEDGEVQPRKFYFSLSLDF
jgi:WD40 repeat protein